MYPMNFNPANYSQTFNPNYNLSSNNPTQLIRVNGLDSAKAYPTNPNSTVPLFDSNDDIFYIKFFGKTYMKKYQRGKQSDSFW